MDTYLENECFFAVVAGNRSMRELRLHCIIILMDTYLENEFFFAVVAGNRSMRELKVALYHYIDGHLPRE